MDLSQWDAAVRPKVQGSWNLHHYLPESMDFFILLSSVSGICGQRGQANYAAGNTYLDALARYRTARGLKAISIDLGAIVSDGYLAENKDVQHRLLKSGSMLPITRRNIFALLERYCDPATQIDTPRDSQIIIGINTPPNMLSRGRDVPDWMRQPFFNAMHHMPSSLAGTTEAAVDVRNFRSAFVEAKTLVDASNIAARALIAKLAQAMSSVQEDSVDLQVAIHSFGVDSLLAVELRSWISREFQADVAVFEILGGQTFASIGRLAARKSTLKRSHAASL
ncbi:MAG: hypothetical protein Q9162_005302 [Coniocarpon cinnabarinum]